MIKSMTGFGRCEAADENRKITVEMKSVNHRYLEVGVKLPRKLGFFETSIRGVLKDYLQRGKVDVFVTYEDYSEGTVSVKYNRDLAKEYLTYLNEMPDDLGVRNDISVMSVSRLPDVFVLEEQSVDEDELWAYVEKVVRGAAERIVETRIAEGDRLCADIIAKLDYMLENVAYIEKRSPETVEEYRSKLRAKLDEVLSDTQVDENRIATEVVIYADKICVDEETVRLKSHIEHMKETLLAGGAIGRKLDFIAQEMNREANTILSKAGDLDISNKAIELKTDIEKVREQIQNIE
ncbi:MAG: YicC family protein [Lachnospiraceae bacterium]|nr:YicC family protein [Lachnospiraceae bacterium]